MSKVKKSNLKKSGFISPFKNYWVKDNYIFLAVGIILLIIGYVAMAQGEWDNSVSLVVSPIILLIAYLIIFPLSIFYKKQEKK